MSENTSLRILLADDDARVRPALHKLLVQESEGLVVRECPDIACLAVEIRGFKPDLVFLDWELPGRPAAALLLALSGLEKNPRIIVLSARPEIEREALAAGADAFVCKGEAPERLLIVFRELVWDLFDSGVDQAEV